MLKTDSFKFTTVGELPRYISKKGKVLIHYITGGERSGKSSLAQALAEQVSQSPYYLATARVLDDEFAKRVKRHVIDRTTAQVSWTTIEADKNLASALKAQCAMPSSTQNLAVVIDCVTLWLTNYVMDYDYDIEKCLSAAKQEIDQLIRYAHHYSATIFIVSNEIGMSLHAASPEGRQFVSLQGWVNQYLAQVADKATLVVSGLPVTLK